MKKRAAVVLVLLVTGSGFLNFVPAQEPDQPRPEKQAGDFEEVQNVRGDALRSVTSVAISPDGRFAYAAAFNSDSVTSFERDAATGVLTLIDTQKDQNSMGCVVALRLSRDGSFAVASAFRSNAITLFRRDTESGHLKQLSVARDGENENAGLNFVIDANFSPDNRFIYTAASDGVGVFRIDDGKLAFAEVQNAAGKLKGLRDCRLSADGLTVYAAGAGSDNVAVFNRDNVSGKLSLRQMLTDGEGGIEALGGAFRVAPTPDGKHVYVSTGRFGGDQAVSAFAVQSDGTLKLIEELVNGVDALDDFEGGNDVNISPDGAFVFALATISDRIARFQRDAETGKLIAFGSQQVGDKATPGAAGLCFSPDGKFVYVADENASAIVVYRMP